MGKKRNAIERHEGDFTAYAKTVTTDQARAAFEARHGYAPAHVHDGGTIWLAGPKRKNGAKGLENGQRHTVSRLNAENAGKGANSRSRSILARVEAAQRDMTAERARQMVMELGGVM